MILDDGFCHVLKAEPRFEGLVACHENKMWLCLFCPALSHYFCSPQGFRILLNALLVKADFVVARLFLCHSRTSRTPVMFFIYLLVTCLGEYVSCKAAVEKDILTERQG